MIINANSLRESTEISMKRFEKDNMSLLIINASDDKASERYVDMKKKLCEQNNIKCVVYKFKKGCTEEEIINYINKSQDNYTGVLVQAPLYDNLKYNNIVKHIKPEKDVDGLTIYNQGAVYDSRHDGIRTCTAKGVELLLAYNDISVKGKFVVIVGRGKMIADPLAKMLEYDNATVVKIHTGTDAELAESLIAKSDIIISCAGRDMSHLINPTVAVNAEAVIGVGFRYEDGKQLQDFNIDDDWNPDVKLTGHTNGTGSATLAALLANLVLCKYHK